MMYCERSRHENCNKETNTYAASMDSVGTVLGNTNSWETVVLTCCRALRNNRLGNP
jgi:hypothetical protein